MKTLANLVLAIIAVFSPAGPMIFTSLALVSVDLVTGLLVAYKQKIPITSSGLKRTVTKTVLYLSAILLFFLIQEYLTGESVPVCRIVTGYIGLVEGTSVLENMNKLGDVPLFQAILDKLNQTKKP